MNEPLTEREREELEFLDALLSGKGRMDNYAATANDWNRWNELRRRGFGGPPPTGAGE